MKKILSIGFLLFAVICFSSCLKAGLDDLPVYEEAEVSNVRFEYRWWDEAAKRLRVVTITTAKEFNGSTVTCTLTLPNANNTFTQAIRDQVSLSNIVCSLDISTAARVEPVNGAPQLGTPADFSSRDFSYLVTAADGKTKKEWTIKIAELKK
ncbi:DUF5018 domain-containing protein [Parabacteroides sp. OttesenSCG-928-K15]|nr:DUF5018 domain-containing protein [Parabacteroides sp. OttesenSCG-928-K15]